MEFLVFQGKGVVSSFVLSVFDKFIALWNCLGRFGSPHCAPATQVVQLAQDLEKALYAAEETAHGAPPAKMDSPFKLCATLGTSESRKEDGWKLPAAVRSGIWTSKEFRRLFWRVRLLFWHC